MNIPYLLFGKAIKRKLAEGNLRPKGFEGMTHAYVGLDAMAYYQWPDIAEVPPIRIKEIEGYLRWMDAGISQGTMEEICARIDEAHQGALTAKTEKDRAKHIAIASKWMDELKLRKKDIIPLELYYNIAATLVAREDEDPRALDRTTHKAKVQMLREAGQGGHVFFSAVATLKGCLGVAWTTEQGLLGLLTNWTAQEQRMQALRAVLSAR